MELAHLPFPVIFRLLHFLPRGKYDVNASLMAMFDAVPPLLDTVAVGLALHFVRCLRSKRLCSVRSTAWTAQLLSISDDDGGLTSRLLTTLSKLDARPAQLMQNDRLPLRRLVTDACNGAPVVRIPCKGLPCTWFASLLSEREPQTASSKKACCTGVVVTSEGGHSKTTLRFLSLVRPASTPTLDACCHAASEGHVDCLTTLRDLGADLTQCDANGVGPIHKAAMNGHADALRFLMTGPEALTAPRTKTGFHSPLNYAVIHKHLHIVRLAHSVGANCLASDGCQTPLSFAVEMGDLNMTRFLIEVGADVNAPCVDATRMRPLHQAARDSRVQIAQYLLSVGADVKIVTGTNESAMRIAVWNGDVAMARLLHAAGGDATEVGLLHVAATLGKFELAEFLISAGSDVNAYRARTPLHEAVRKGSFEIVRLLVEHGADVNRLDVRGETPFSIASKANKEAIARFLLRAGS